MSSGSTTYMALWNLFHLFVVIAGSRLELCYTLCSVVATFPDTLLIISTVIISELCHEFRFLALFWCMCECEVGCGI